MVAFSRPICGEATWDFGIQREPSDPLEIERQGTISTADGWLVFSPSSGGIVKWTT